MTYRDRHDFHVSHLDFFFHSLTFSGGIPWGDFGYVGRDTESLSSLARSSALESSNWGGIGEISTQVMEFNSRSRRRESCLKFSKNLITFYRRYAGFFWSKFPDSYPLNAVSPIPQWDGCQQWHAPKRHPASFTRYDCKFFAQLQPFAIAIIQYMARWY